MSKQLTGKLIGVGEASIVRGGEWKFSEILVRDTAGTEHRLEGYQMDVAVSHMLAPGSISTFYFSKLWGTIYGIRHADGSGVFMARAAAWYAPLMSLGMLFLGLATSMFILPLLIAAAGAAGLMMWWDALAGRRRYRRDECRL